VTVYPKTRESTIERRALDAAGQWAEVAQRCEAECQRLRARVAELEARIEADRQQWMYDQRAR
jgi:BMFP domain-containing protein YqiC